MFTVASPENEFGELAEMISTAIERARQLNMHAGAYILSMALAEVSKAAKAIASSTDGGKKP